MSVELFSLIFVGGLFLLLAAGTEIAVAFGVLASIGLVLFGYQHVQIAWTGWEVLDSFTLIAMPLFVFMGQMFAKTGVIRSLFDVANKWLGGLPGGLANSVIAACAVFGAMSGSSIASAATFSTITFPEMQRAGYSNKLSFGVIAVGGTLAVLIPPSIIFIIYGAWQNVSIARLFAAGLIPGIILSGLLMLTVVIQVKINPSIAPKVPPIPWRQKLAAAKDILPWLLIIALILGVIFGGVMTATEASAMGAFLSVVVAMAYRKLNYSIVKDCMLSAVRVTAMVGFIMITARMLSFVVQEGGLTDSFARFLMGLHLGKYGTLTFFIIMYLILGCFFDAAAMLLLTMPFVTPVMQSLRLDPIWWGVVYVILAEIGMVTPPFGLNLFTIHGVLPKYSIMTIAAGSLPFLIPMLLMIWILIFFPDLALWLPRFLYAR